MLGRIVSLLFCTLVVAAAATAYNDRHPVPGSHPEFTIYRLKQNITGELLRDDQAAKLAANLEELIMAHDYERKFSFKNVTHNLETKFYAEPYYEISHNDQCSVNNGNCAHICETVGGQRVCSCDEGYTLIGATDCSATSSCDFVLSGTAGEFTIDRGYCQWLIKAPNLHAIKITLHGTTRNLRDDFYDYTDTRPEIGEIYDGNSTRASLISHIKPQMAQTVLTSSGEYVLIKSLGQWNHYSYTQRVSYETGSPYLEISPGRSQGRITVLSEGEDCFSLNYSTPQDGSLWVTRYKSHNGRQNYHEHMSSRFSFQDNDGKWKRNIFLIPMTDSNRKRFDQGTTVLNFEFDGEGTKVYSLRKCSNLEYHAVGRKLPLGPDRVCRNGGAYSRNLCSCPPGFVGDRCQEGCGPNRYGENCSKLCSFLPSACEGMLFCTEESCLCAPGLQGINCDTPCNPGSYGASCQQQCGKCRDGEPCDRYTGVCASGCAAGFHPPLCQQTYNVLLSAPDIIGVTYNSMKIRIPFGPLTGEGEPIFYEVQYKEEEETTWSKFSPRKIPSKTEFRPMREFEIAGLLPGRVYETRVIMIDKDGGSYQTDVPKTKATTKCLGLHKADYTFSAKEVDETGILLEWSYEHDKTSMMCEIVAFELSVASGSEQLQFVTREKKGSKRLSDVLPDMSYRFQLVGKTVTGQRTPPVEIEVRTPAAAPGRVRSVEASPLASGRQLNVTWRPPWGAHNTTTLSYAVSYQCVRLLACDGGDCSSSSGHARVSETSALLGPLLPHALYRLEVASMSPSGLLSPSYVVNALTADAVPHVTPSAAENPILAVTNTSVSISWMPPEDCSGLNGYIYGYSYSLVDNDTDEVIQQGTVPENILSVNFSVLVPSHCYDAHITVVSSGGTSLLDELRIPFCTTSTAPDRVQSLSVYKRGRRMVGLRWSPPLNTYGDIASFSISYSREGSGHTRKLVAEPTRCGAWPRLFCYTVTGLSPGKKYLFQVQTRNKEVNMDGEPAAVEAITSEGVSTPPVNLRIINSTESSMLVEWGMPDNINGQLRSFIIIVEQIDTQADSEECCDEIPLQDYRVASEEPSYLYEITGLSAASTYSVTVSAKTVTLGEDSRVTGHTFPPRASLPHSALAVVKADHGSSYQADDGEVMLKVRPADRIAGVNRKYFLLYLTNDSATQQPSHDELAASLKPMFTENYHLLSEYTQEEIENQSVVTFHLKELGFVSKEIQSQKYALVLIQDYMGNQSVDIFITEETGDEMEE